MGKVGLDGHDRGPKVVARALRDAGMEVVYTGIHQTPEMIVEAAIQEDVDVVGLSIHSGAHMTLLPRVVSLLKEHECNDINVIAGGIIPEHDVPALNKVGISHIFTPGTPTSEVVRTIKNIVSNSPKFADTII